MRIHVDVLVLTCINKLQNHEEHLIQENRIIGCVVPEINIPTPHGMVFWFEIPHPHLSENSTLYSAVMVHTFL